MPAQPTKSPTTWRGLRRSPSTRAAGGHEQRLRVDEHDAEADARQLQPERGEHQEAGDGRRTEDEPDHVHPGLAERAAEPRGVPDEQGDEQDGAAESARWAVKTSAGASRRASFTKMNAELQTRQSTTASTRVEGRAGPGHRTRGPSNPSPAVPRDGIG